MGEEDGCAPGEAETHGFRAFRRDACEKAEERHSAQVVGEGKGELVEGVRRC